MKVLSLLFIALFSVATASASDEVTVPAAVATSFQTSFKNATELSWKQSGAYVKADFSIDGQYVSAFYNTDAVLVAVTRNVSSLQLPFTLQAALRQGYSAYWIADLFELSDDNGTTYYVTVENGDEKLTLKTAAGNTWEVYRKVKKA